MPRILKEDKDAIEGLPLELLVICVVIAITIPTVWGFAGMYIRQQTENDLMVELEHLKKTVEEVGSSEEGNMRIIEMDLSGHPLARIDYVEIGGEIPGTEYVRYRIRGREESAYKLGGFNLANISGGEPVILDISGEENVFMVKRSGMIDGGVEIIEIGLIEGRHEK